MDTKIRIVVLSGSIRSQSLNVMLAKNAVVALESDGVEVKFIDLRNFDMPLYDGDVEDQNGLPDGVMRLHEEINKANGFIVTSPEYNGFITPLLKNVVDWLSRSVPSHLGYVPFRRKPILLMAASPGKFGGLRGLQSARQLFTNVGAFVVPDQMTLPHAEEAFDGEGHLIDEKPLRRLKKLTSQFVLDLKGLSSYFH